MARSLTGKKSNIRPLNAEGEQELAFQAKVSLAQQKRDAAMHAFRRRLGWAFCALIFIVGIVSYVNASHAKQSVTRQANQAEATLKDTQSETKTLKQQKKDLKDPAYLQNFVRNRFMYTKSGELVFSLPNQKTVD